MYSKELKIIYNLLQQGEQFGKFKYWNYYNNVPYRFPMFWTNLAKDDIRNLIYWNNAGSSHNKNNLKSLHWIITTIFGTDAKTFLKEYMRYSEYKRLTESINTWIEQGEKI